jgi:hypothetical protein
MTDNTSALDHLAEQINACHAEVKKAFKTSLEKAIEAGEHLIEAREVVKAAGQKWKDWLSEHCPDISQRTANVYKQLAENKKAVMKHWQQCCQSEDGELSLRGALDAIPRTPEQRERAKQSAATREAKKLERKAQQSAVEPPAQKSPATIEDMLRGEMAPDLLFTALRETWDVEEIGALALRLYKFLDERGWKPPTQEPAPSVVPAGFERRV